jgi:hypothetical protein
MTVAAVGKPRERRVLFEGNTSTEELASVYAVPKSHDVVISFAPEVKNLHGSISVRARILRPTPIEIPVENYTVVNEKELKEERKLLIADDLDFFRERGYRDLVDHVSKLQRAATDYGALLNSTFVAGLQAVYSEDRVKSWISGDAEEAEPPQTRRAPEAVSAAAANLRRAGRRGSVLQQASRRFDGHSPARWRRYSAMVALWSSVRSDSCSRLSSWRSGPSSSGWKLATA